METLKKLVRRLEGEADLQKQVAILQEIGEKLVSKYVPVSYTHLYGIKTVVSMNPIMIDGTGMCGGCRLTVGGETKFACVDGPDFDGHQVDFDEAMARASMYKPFERTAFDRCV